MGRVPSCCQCGRIAVPFPKELDRPESYTRRLSLPRGPLPRPEGRAGDSSRAFREQARHRTGPPKKAKANESRRAQFLCQACLLQACPFSFTVSKALLLSHFCTSVWVSLLHLASPLPPGSVWPPLLLSRLPLLSSPLPIWLGQSLSLPTLEILGVVRGGWRRGSQSPLE